MLGTLVLAGIGGMLMSNPRKRRKRRNPSAGPRFAKSRARILAKIKRHWSRSKHHPWSVAKQIAIGKRSGAGNAAVGRVKRYNGRPTALRKDFAFRARNPRKGAKTYMARNPRKGAKTYMARILQSYYPGAGWSDVLEEETSREMKAQLKTYRENDPRTPYRVIYRRVPIESNPRRRAILKHWRQVEIGGGKGGVKPFITYARAGRAMKGEPSTVYRTRRFTSVAARDNAFEVNPKRYSKAAHFLALAKGGRVTAWPKSAAAARKGKRLLRKAATFLRTRKSRRK